MRKRISLKALKQAAENTDIAKYSFVNPMLRDMHNHFGGYEDAFGFFKDLAYGGCQSGMVGMFIYNTDCAKFYKKHMEDMEAFKEDLEEEMGDSIPNRNQVPHYTFMCWLCYEEVARIVSEDLGFEG